MRSAGSQQAWYSGISQSDAVSRQQAMAFLDQEQATWMARDHPRGQFRADLTTGASASSQGQFNLPYYIQCRSWYSEHFQGVTVDRFKVAWCNVRGHAVFVGQRSDRNWFTVNPRAGSQAGEFAWGDQASPL